MERDFDLEALFRDKQIVNIIIDLEYYASETNNQVECISLNLLDYNNKLIKLNLINPSKLDCYFSVLKGLNIGFVKCFKSDDFKISLDPFDEREDEITEKDNFIIQFQSYEIG